jgi:hypothetical protein
LRYHVKLTFPPGRVNSRGLLDIPDRAEKTGTWPSQRRRGKRSETRETFRPPDEVLFKRKDAPERYEEYDIYNSHERDLPQAGSGILPESDLLKAIHGYTSNFYGAMGRRRKHDIGDGIDVDESSMDETALIAFGILLEEATREVLGHTGEQVFTEGVDDGEPASSAILGHTAGYSALSEESDPDTKPQPKRRRTIKVESASWD